MLGVQLKTNYFIKCNKYSKNLKISYFFNKRLVISIICDKCCSNDDKIFKEEESFEILTFFVLINNINE